MLCPCHSGKKYKTCCESLHQDGRAENALALMRSRYAAYALSNADYIIKTTHPLNPHYNKNFEEWKKEILIFCQKTEFKDLRILASSLTSVTFLAILSYNGQDASFTEKSTFECVDGNWLYLSGEVSR
ncbi:MAG: SEC-C domain-containing protein [Parachlamydia sp.]|jgi:SEC-C motif-containing protein|nr:SEC-C domain-containing protein [Parachlamydia sp.]